MNVINYALENKDYTYGEQLLAPLKKWKWQKMLFGLYLKSKQYDNARYLLNHMPQHTVYELSFVELQEINVDRSQYGNNSITTPQITKVYDIATGVTPAAGYAWTVYYLLTGIDLDTPHSNPGSKSRTVPDPILYELSVSPNPANVSISIEGIAMENIKEISIVSVNGSERYIPQIEKNNKINIQNHNEGIYIIRATLVTGQILTEKFIKI